MHSRVVVCAGSGGVGKTTVAAALGVRAASLGRRTLVLTVDPAKRLATALGLEMKDDQDKPVSEAQGDLSAAVIDSKKIFDNFILKHGQQADVISRIMKNRLYQQMSTTLSGSQEFTALERLLQSTESDRYDLVVLDTPPTKHAVDFLTAPQRINSLFQEGVTRWFFSGSEKSGGFFAGLINKGTRTVLKSLETLTGAQFIEELIDFFGAVRSIQSVLRERSHRTHQLLTSTETRFITVTSFDAAKLLEARYLQGQLRELDYHLAGVVINRAFPAGIREGEIEETPPTADAKAYEKLLQFYRRFRTYYSDRYELYDEFARNLPKSVVVKQVPEYQRDIYGIADLQALALVLGAKES